MKYIKFIVVLYFTPNIVFTAQSSTEYQQNCIHRKQIIRDVINAAPRSRQQEALLEVIQFPDPKVLRKVMSLKEVLIYSVEPEHLKASLTRAASAEQNNELLSEYDKEIKRQNEMKFRRIERYGEDSSDIYSLEDQEKYEIACSIINEASNRQSRHEKNEMRSDLLHARAIIESLLDERDKGKSDHALTLIARDFLIKSKP
jgi:hypothetical protein